MKKTGDLYDMDVFVPDPDAVIPIEALELFEGASARHHARWADRLRERSVTLGRACPPLLHPQTSISRQRRVCRFSATTMMPTSF